MIVELLKIEEGMKERVTHFSKTSVTVSTISYFFSVLVQLLYTIYIYIKKSMNGENYEDA